MEELVEKVAAAIYDQMIPYETTNWNDARDYARAAIEATLAELVQEFRSWERLKGFKPPSPS